MTLLMRVHPDELPVWLAVPGAILLCVAWVVMAWRDATRRVDRMTTDTETDHRP